VRHYPVPPPCSQLSVPRAAPPASIRIPCCDPIETFFHFTDRVNLVAAKAANIAADLPAPDLLPDLLRAFDRLFDDPVKRDPQCWGKNAIARALKDLGHRESPAFLRGAAHIQMEPVWGGQEDAAGPLRGICLLALPACPDLPREQVLRHMVNALTEPSPTVRADAARALAEMQGDDCALLLRLKARARDAEPAVTGRCSNPYSPSNAATPSPSFANSSPPPTRCPKKLPSPSADPASPMP
jgi:hypothetical protein